MPQYPILRLQKGKEQNIRYGHPWIFSGALEKTPKEYIQQGIAHGDMVHVAGQNDTILGTGTFSAHSMMAVRVFDFSDTVIDKKWIEQKLKKSGEYRQFLGYGKEGAKTTGYRFCFGESDGFPGLVIDRYDDVLVLQVSTQGTEKLKKDIVEVLKKMFSPRAIYQKSAVTGRNEEALPDKDSLLFGKLTEPVPFLENGHTFLADPLKGQKTGFFLDQKDLRLEIQKLADKKKILNLFSYTGAAGIYALKGGAKSAHQVDGSDWALAQCMENAKLNKIPKTKYSTEKTDIFSWLGRPIHEGEYDMVIVDPPALIKSRSDLENGKKAYHFLNRAAMRLVNPGGIFVTSSCSHFLSTEDFQMILQRASAQNNLSLRIISSFGQSSDHPVSLRFPESQYLRSFVCLVEKA